MGRRPIGGVVVVLRIASGHSADYLLNAVAAGRENYYTGAVAEGEPPGRWYGAGAAAHGLFGEVDAQDMRALFEHFVDPSDPAFGSPDGWSEASKLGHAGRQYLSAEQIYARALDAEPAADAERREQLRVEASKAERNNVAFLDATFSVQKSVTVLHTAFEAQQVAAENAGRPEEAAQWGAHRQAVEDAIWAGNRAMLDYLSQHAGYSRVGHHGGNAGRFIDAHDWTVASFLQHDSRDHDPQLHIHNPVLNRVRCADGQWRTLDSRGIHKFRGAAGAVGERVMEEFLAHTLGVEFATRPDGAAREIVGVDPAAMELFSTRSRRIGPKAAELIEAFRGEFGREPNALERDRLAQTATLATRRAKSHTGQSREEMLRDWDTRLRGEIRGGLAAVAHDVLDNRPETLAPMAWSPVAVLETALAAVQAKKAGWTAPDLTREISNALPDRLGITGPGQMGQLLDRLTTEGLKLAVALDAARPGAGLEPAQYRLANGRSAFDAPGAKLYATPDHVHTERVLVGATADRGGTAMGRAELARFFDQLSSVGIRLGADQEAAVRGLLTSGAQLETLIGPAGTGKSFVVGTLAKAWTDPTLWGGRQQRVFGLATSQNAAEVLAGHGLQAVNTARWLATQTRLSEGRAKGADAEWTLGAGDVVVIDESSMADTDAIAAVHAHAAAVGAKVVPTGDFHQLGAIGAGGALEMLAGAGTAYELTDARRFTHAWERAASLRLRAGDTAVLEEYHRHGRIIDGGAAEQAEHTAARRWLGDTLAGKHSLLVVDTNEQTARLNADLRAELVALGRVREQGVRLGREGTTAGVGDLVRARRLAWELVGYEGNTAAPITQEQYRVLETRADGSMVVAPIRTTAGSEGGETLGARMTLPASYVTDDLTLGYAVTGHGAEGLTVDTDYNIATPATRAEALYPAATRGRESNTIIVVTQTAPAPDAATGETAQAIRRDPRAVLGTILDNTHRERSATAEAAESAEAMASVKTAGEMFAEVASAAATERTAGWLDSLVDTGALSEDDRRRIAAEDGAASLGRILRRVELAGHDPHQALASAISERDLDGSRQLTNVIHTRIVDGYRDRLDPAGHSYQQWLPAATRPDTRAYLEEIAQAADTRRDELGAQLVSAPPAWALEALGPVPAGPAARRDWRTRAGIVAAHRELSDHDDDSSAIGPAPAPGLVEANASWRAAWAALGRPDTDRDEAEMTDGRLRLRVRAYQREQSWAPRRVDNELAGTIQARDHHRALATRRQAAADAAVHPAARAELATEAEQAAALADTLEQRIGQLDQLEHERGMWLAHTAGTRTAAERAALELANRRAVDEQVEPEVTAEQWMTAHRDAERDEEAHREITPADLHPADLDAPEHERAETAHDQQDPAGRETTTGAPDRHDRTDADERPDGLVPDIRAVAQEEPDPVDEHTVRVPTADETAESIRRAQRALTEITERNAADQAWAADEQRSAQLARWHTDDTQHDDHGVERHDAADEGPALERAGADG